MVTIVKCPTCNKSVQWTEQNKFRPFCSKHCKDIDLGAWAEEKYKISAVDDDVEDVSDIPFAK